MTYRSLDNPGPISFLMPFPTALPIFLLLQPLRLPCCSCLRVFALAYFLFLECSPSRYPQSFLSLFRTVNVNFVESSLIILTFSTNLLTNLALLTFSPTFFLVQYLLSFDTILFTYLKFLIWPPLIRMKPP